MSALSVFQPRRLSALFRADIYNIIRDPIMALMLVLVMALPCATWLWRTEMDFYALNAFGIVDISVYVSSFVLLLTAVLMGWMTGMLLLEDRDDGPLLALEVTPIGKNGFLLYRTGITALFAFLASLVIGRLLLSQHFGLQLFLAVLVALEAVIITFALLAMANNKVEGLALSKVLNIAALIPLMVLIPSGLRYLAAWVPSYWVGELLYGDSLPVTMVYLLALLVHIVALVFLYHSIQKRLG